MGNIGKPKRIIRVEPEKQPKRPSPTDPSPKRKKETTPKREVQPAKT